ncbi:hypothetical protein DACRYDRAFT_104471 [Dacryopinax primogenitus]|uniref:Uncharacterized protein n=1 Tax=Dacryopinax primogenitus (strain DJM 731) TaxID=1858805 RepID=M5G2X8_DACPD|nr:uncharacterized protein DACRYDRAFT_104471 [Dacryopinax primogenitus]EJU04586.1 hypothetical protein DACRYDRAFT_104471 [Dacryopinax primogenitus]
MSPNAPRLSDNSLPPIARLREKFERLLSHPDQIIPVLGDLLALPSDAIHYHPGAQYHSCTPDLPVRISSQDRLPGQYEQLILNVAIRIRWIAVNGFLTQRAMGDSLVQLEVLVVKIHRELPLQLNFQRNEGRLDPGKHEKAHTLVTGGTRAVMHESGFVRFVALPTDLAMQASFSARNLSYWIAHLT